MLDGIPARALSLKSTIQTGLLFMNMMNIFFFKEEWKGKELVVLTLTNVMVESQVKNQPYIWDTEINGAVRLSSMFDIWG